MNPVLDPRNIALARRANQYGARSSLRIVVEAKLAGLPVSVGFALVQKESGFANIFGHDVGGPFPGQPVTKTKVRALLVSVNNGGTSNGVGYTQLTWPGFIRQAEAMGGAHLVKYQCRVGFRALASLIHEYGRHEGMRRYNGSGPAAEAYAHGLGAMADTWHQRLA